MVKQRALVLIPCCKEKRTHTSQEDSTPALQDIEDIRARLQASIEQTPRIASKPANQRGILNPNATSTSAANLYVGNLYRGISQTLRNALAGHYSQVDILIVSALYGLVQLGEGIKEYELRMDDSLIDGTRVWKFWQREGLWRLLQCYVSQRNISCIWSLLPNSMPSFPYHQVFNRYWNMVKDERNAIAFHVKVFKSDGRSVGTGSGAKRGEWLREILSTNPSYLVGNPFPPQKLSTIPLYAFRYEPC